MEDFLKKRFSDLAAQSDRTNRFTFTDFLNEAEQAAFYAVLPALPRCGYTLWGGREDADRVMLRFGDPELLGYEEPFPIKAICIAPLQAKFAEQLSHRDYLGALMHLGIERGELGDILTAETAAYVFCRETMADYICRELTRIRHTSVRCTVTDELPAEFIQKTEPGTVQAASERMDGVIAKVCRISRSDCAALFQAGKVFLNGACTQDHSVQLKAGDKVSVRGYGKFRYLGIGGRTKKGNLILRYEKFV